MDWLRFIVALVAICTLCLFAGQGAEASIGPNGPLLLLPLSLFAGRMVARYAAAGRW